jgi:SAM-dependent methyltransferase
VQIDRPSPPFRQLDTHNVPLEAGCARAGFVSSVTQSDITSFQLEGLLKTWNGAIREFYPEYAGEWSDPAQHLAAHHTKWNLIEAARDLDWPSVLPVGGHLKVLDLGCGTGWLSALLSRFDQVESIIALDADSHNLETMLPEVCHALGADMRKVKPTRGLFQPLPFENGELDLVVASSAVHHAQDIISLFLELRRVVKDDGLIIALNETPAPNWNHIVRMGRSSLRAIAENVTGRIRRFGPRVSSLGLLYDPYLGDVAYSRKQWDFIFKSSGLTYQEHVSPYYPYKAKDSQSVRLTHFICRKSAKSPR